MSITNGRIAFDRWMNRQKILWRWKLGGARLPAPDVIKHHFLFSLAQRYGCQIFCETGTYQGGTVQEAIPHFASIISIELDPTLYAQAHQRFQGIPKIKLFLGDSGRVLQDVCHTLTERTFFWLDGHYSGGVTAKGELETPIIQELRAIARNNSLRHVVAIDDARLFIGQNDYPPFTFLSDYVRQNFPEYTIQQHLDIITLAPHD